MPSPRLTATPALANIRVLVAEDDPEVAQSLDLYLQLLSCRVDVAADGAQALDRAVHGNYDLILLDLSLPRVDGLMVCQTVRQQRVFTPILMLTARASEGDKVMGLNAGADDYLTKPFSHLELQARVHALMRRARTFPPTQPTRPITSVALAIDVEQRVVTIDGRAVALTAREFDLLVTLARHPGRVYSRAQLLDSVWGYHHEGYGRTVNSHINRLRAKIEMEPSRPRYVVTVRSVGYKFADVANVTE
jgi:DNA-binding response OmpR family regulator